ncbi:MAG: hypothetical protein MJ169_02825 [Treponema sp.]|nr:hypothetical protein [Treponema sp.]
MIELDQIPQLLKEQSITIQQACMHIYDILYTNPARFNLISMDVDERSDFLLSLFPEKVKKMISCYDPQKSPFGAFIYTNIQSAKSSWNKKRNLSNLQLKTWLNDTEHALKETEYSFPQEEPKLIRICDNDETQENNPAAEENKLIFKKVFSKRFSFKENKEPIKYYKQAALVLALKSAWYITDSQIEKVSKICEIDSKAITQTVCALKANLITKALAHEEINLHRNYAYSLYSSYQQIMDSLEDKEGFLYQKYKKRSDYQKSSWMNKSRKLKNGRNKISPSNAEVAQYLGIEARKVSFYISQARQLN